MSRELIRKALEDKLAAMPGVLDTAVENVKFTPVVGTAYQKINLLFAQPDNVVFGPYYREQGVFQVTLCYPPDVGSGDANAQADALQAFFKRGTSLPLNDSNYLTVYRTPTIGPAFKTEDRWCLPISIRWFAEFFN